MLTGRAMLGHGVATRCLLLRLSPIPSKARRSAGTFRWALRFTDFDKTSGGPPVTSPCPSAFRTHASSQRELITCGNARKLSSQDRPQACCGATEIGRCLRRCASLGTPKASRINGSAA